MVRKTKEEALATRHRLLDAAERLFHRDGVSATSLADIAREAGVTRGAIYWHFTDKADLFDAMMSRVILPMEGGAARPLPGDDPLQAVRAEFMDVLRRTVDDPQVQRVFDIATHRVEYVGELQAVRERAVAAHTDWLARMEQSLRLAMRQGRLGRRMPARAAAIGLHALIAGLLRTWLLDPQSFDLMTVGRQTLDAYLAGLALPTPG
jgi:TetR/AcrR family acrAB operon transcriptional repressor